MQDQEVFLCEDTVEGIYTAVYDAWAAHVPEERLSIQCREHYSPCFFTTVTEVETDSDKAEKVVCFIKAKLGWHVYEMTYYAALSCAEDKMDTIYRFLKLGFQVGAGVADMHGEPVVCRMFELERNVKNESHLFREFLRFHETKEGILIARINPRNQVLSYLAEHFSDRFPEENFVILDDVHFMAVFHEKEKDWFLGKLTEEELSYIWEMRESEEYEDLWKTFFKTIAIEERVNKKCQRNMCPIRYRDYMVEFQS